MKAYRFTSNAWGYVHADRSENVVKIMSRLGRIGFDGFDLLLGDDAFPKLTIAEAELKQDSLRNTHLPLASLVLVSFDLSDIKKCVSDLVRTAELAKKWGVPHVHLLPRKIGITHQSGMENMRRVWSEVGNTVLASGIPVSAENHAISPDPDEDIFLIRTERDFFELLEISDDGIGVKFDPAWLLWAGENPISALNRLLPYTEILDVKDSKDRKFVSPGTGDVDFKALEEMVRGSERINFISVEVESHHFAKPEITDEDQIDLIHKSDLEFYRTLFGRRS